MYKAKSHCCAFIKITSIIAAEVVFKHKGPHRFLTCRMLFVSPNP